MPASVLIDRAPAQQHSSAAATNGQHSAANSADAMAAAAAEVYCDVDAAAAAGAIRHLHPSNGFQGAHQLAKLASNASLVAPSNAVMASSSAGSRGGSGGGVVGSLLADVGAETAMVARKSANMTECVPVPSSEHVAEIVGRQGIVLDYIPFVSAWFPVDSVATFLDFLKTWKCPKIWINKYACNT